MSDAHGNGTQVRSVLALHSGALGDCVLGLHLVDALRSVWGGLRITVAARSPIVRWAARHGVIDEARSLDELGAHLWYQADGDLPGESVEFLRGFDRIVSFLGGASEPVAVRLKAVCGDGVLSIDPRPARGGPRSRIHITRQWAAQLDEQGVSIAVGGAPRIDLTNADRCGLRERLARRFDGRADRIAICHPGSGGRGKCLPVSVFEKLACSLQSCGWSVCWMIGPDERERDGPSLIGRLESSAPVIFEESAEEAADLAAAADAYIGNDAGMTHVAALAGVRTVAIFGPTDPDVWAPLGERATVVPFSDVSEPVDPLVRAIESLLEQT